MQDSITKTLKAIADPTRREILRALVVASSALPISQLSSQFEMSRQGVTKHIKQLQDAGLVELQAQGRERYCYPNPKPLSEVQDWLSSYEAFWKDSLGRLGNYLDSKA